MRTIKLTCYWCGSLFKKSFNEYNRRIKLQGKNARLFCTHHCAACFGNNYNGKMWVEITKECPVCHKNFITHTGSKSKTFCSRSCASSGSVSKYRRETARRVGKGNIKPSIELLAKALRSREAWKYKDIKEYLEHHNEEYIFEYPTCGYIFDLCLAKRKILIEFDGKYHTGKQKEKDNEKDRCAMNKGWIVIRKKTDSNKVIHPRILYDVVF